MTGFDETVPPDDEPAHDENSVEQRPEHDSTEPSSEDGPTTDELREPDAMGGDDDLRSGQYGSS